MLAHARGLPRGAIFQGVEEVCAVGQRVLDIEEALVAEGMDPSATLVAARVLLIASAGTLLSAACDPNVPPPTEPSRRSVRCRRRAAKWRATQAVHGREARADAR